MPGVKLSIAASEEAKKKNLCLVSGLCWRYDPGVRETIKRIQDGAIGEIVAIQETYVRGPYILRERKPGWNEMQYQFQNWYHFNWLSGDQTGAAVDPQHGQGLVGAGRRAAAEGLGPGRTPGVRRAEIRRPVRPPGHRIRVCQRRANVRLLPRHPRLLQQHSDVIIGTKGRAFCPPPRIEGEKPWRYKGPTPSMYDVEHRELFDAIRAGKTINNGHYMCIDIDAGDPRPDGLLHGPGDHVGSGHEVEVKAVRCRVTRGT